MNNFIKVLSERPWQSSLLITLLAIKFAFLPIIEWQDNIKAELELQNKKLNTIKRLMKNSENIKLEKLQLETVNESFKDILPMVSSETLFKLDKRDWIEKLSKERNVDITNIGWSNIVGNKNDKLKKLQMQLKLKGKTKAMLKLQTAIESAPQLLQIDGYAFNIKRHINSSMGSATGFINIDFYLELNNE